MKHLKYSFLFIILTGLFIWAGYGLYKKDKNIGYEIFNLEYQLMGTRDHLKEKIETARLTISFENTRLPIPEDDLKKITPGVIIRLHNDICMACYSGSVKYFFDKLHKIGIPYSVLGSYPNSSKFRKQLKDMEARTEEMINIPTIENYPPDKIMTPYAFVLSQEGEIKNLFFLDKTDSTLSNEYLNLIKRNREKQ